MPVSSYVIRCEARDRSGVVEHLRRLPGVELGDATDTGIPVVAVTETTREAEEVGQALERVAGVRAATLVYHNFEDVADRPAVSGSKEN